jgi:hypothetical protein
VSARVARKTAPGSDEWAADNLEYTRSLLRVIREDATMLAEQMTGYRAYAERLGASWDTFVRDELTASPALVAAIESLAALAGRER